MQAPPVRSDERRGGAAEVQRGDDRVGRVWDLAMNGPATVRRARTAPLEDADCPLENGSRIAVIGGGPGGSFFSYFVLQLARRAGLDLAIDIYEPRDYSRPGPKSCNMCGGIVSESLLQKMVAEGIRLPEGVIQRRIDSYFLHSDVGSVRIETPLREKRIAAVYRGCGPRDSQSGKCQSFDSFVLQMAIGEGANWRQERVSSVSFGDGLPRVKSQRGSEEAYSLVVGAVGVNSAALKLFEGLGFGYVPPNTQKAYISEFHLGSGVVDRYLGNAMHVFLLDIPRLEFAAIIPKSDYVTVCLLGEDVDKELVEAFLGSREVKECMPPHWRAPDAFCHCSPRINVTGSIRPFADRFVCVGDCGMTRLYKDGIGAAYRTAKAAAVTAVFEGVSERAFRRRYWPTCKKLEQDNKIGKLVFGVTRRIQGSRRARRGVWRMTAREQGRAHGARRMSLVLWDTFTGSAPYREVLNRTLHPMFALRFGLDLAWGDRRRRKATPHRRPIVLKNTPNLLGKKLCAGEVIYHQGEKADCMFVINGGEVEIVRREGDREFCLNVMKDGDLFGVMGLFDEEVRSATARALTDVSVYTLERHALLRSIHEDPSLAFRIMERMAERIDELETALIDESNVKGKMKELQAALVDLERQERPRGDKPRRRRAASADPAAPAAPPPAAS